MNKMHKVFVYGTLKRGEPNYNWFGKCENGIANFLCKGQTINKYPLIIATKYNIPFLLYSPGEGHYVHGELYEINEAMLYHLDILEDHPNYYIREQNLILELKDNKSTVNAWVYFLKAFKPELLKKEMFVSYSNKGDHGLKYMERYFRNTDYDAKTEVLVETK